ncbi:MAG: DNA repair protein RecO [Gammaproteobacteria bacterium]
MRVQDQPVYILHQRPFRDTSQILEIFSRDYGRLSLVSRGSRSPKSRLKAILQPFQALQANWSGRGEMPSLGQVEAAHINRPHLKARALPCAFYMNELIMRLLHKHDVHEDVFELYQGTLYALALSEDIELELRLFEKSLLQYLGFGLCLDTDADSGERVVKDRNYHYFIEHGPVQAGSYQDKDRQALSIRGHSLLCFQSDDLTDKTVRKDIKSLMRYVLAYYLGDKPLKSRELFR